MNNHILAVGKTEFITTEKGNQITMKVINFNGVTKLLTFFE